MMIDGFALRSLSFTPGFSRVLQFQQLRETVSTVYPVPTRKTVKTVRSERSVIHPAEAGCE